MIGSCRAGTLDSEHQAQLECEPAPQRVNPASESRQTEMYRNAPAPLAWRDIGTDVRHDDDDDVADTTKDQHQSGVGLTFACKAVAQVPSAHRAWARARHWTHAARRNATVRSPEQNEREGNVDPIAIGGTLSCHVVHGMLCKGIDTTPRLHSAVISISFDVASADGRRGDRDRGVGASRTTTGASSFRPFLLFLMEPGEMKILYTCLAQLHRVLAGLLCRAECASLEPINPSERLPRPCRVAHVFGPLSGEGHARISVLWWTSILTVLGKSPQKGELSGAFTKARCPKPNLVTPLPNVVRKLVMMMAQIWKLKGVPYSTAPYESCDHVVRRPASLQAPMTGTGNGGIAHTVLTNVNDHSTIGTVTARWAGWQAPSHDAVSNSEIQKEKMKGLRIVPNQLDGEPRLDALLKPEQVIA
ncbi:hypothetical protein EDB86DRAFT_3242145 [Lactarius hatsudake]|nr:hypothetical protein EDB86DRAFT_3242145 [Lactarius hatsudake]